MLLLGRLLAKIPVRVLYAVGAALGALVYALGIRRKVVLSNLALAFPDRPEAERRAIARETYRNLGRMIFDFLRVPALPREELERMFVREGWEHFDEARSRGKGVIAATGHFGNFEVLAAAHTMAGIPITMISRQMGKSGANDVWRGTRTRSGVEDLVVKKGETLKAARRALEAGRVLGYVIDQNQPARHAIFPTFFGVPAATAATPALLAKRTGAAVVFVVSMPLGDGRHRLVMEGPLDPPDTGDREADVLAFMQDLNDRLERHVRAHPEHWYWLHRRWKTRPPAPAPAGRAAAATGTLTPPDGAG
jgi:KDO2-lipid IV(A) lauroyltransferase